MIEALNNAINNLIDCNSDITLHSGYVLEYRIKRMSIENQEIAKEFNLLINSNVKYKLLEWEGFSTTCKVYNIAQRSKPYRAYYILHKNGIAIKESVNNFTGLKMYADIDNIKSM